MHIYGMDAYVIVIQMCTQTYTIQTHVVQNIYAQTHWWGHTQDDQANIITMKPQYTVHLRVLPQGNYPPTAESWCMVPDMTTFLKDSDQPPPAHCVLNYTVKHPYKGHRKVYPSASSQQVGTHTHTHT